MSSHALSAVDAFRSCLPAHPTRSSFANELAGLTICAWNTPWIDGFRLPENDDLVISRHREGSRDVRSLCGDVASERRSEPGCMTAIPPEQAHAFVVAGEVSFESIHLSRQRLRTVSERLADCEQIAQFRFAFHDAFVSGCMDAIFGEANAPGPHSEMFISSVADALLLHLLRPSSSGALQQPIHSDAMARTCALIDENLSKNLSLDELAEEAGLSRSQFVRRFRCEVGVTPHHYKIRRRIRMAGEMLRESRMSLVDIAYALGFCSQSHFTSVFRSMVGATPRRFREEHGLIAADTMGGISRRSAMVTGYDKAQATQT